MSKSKQYLVVIVGIFVLLGAGYSIGRYFAPAKITEKIVEKEVIKTVEVIKEVKVENKDVKTKIVIEEKPDGTKTTTTEIEDKTKTDTTTDTAKTDESTKTKDTFKETVFAKPQWRIGVLGGVSASSLNFTETPRLVYGGLIEKRIFGPVSAGVWATSSKDIGVLATWEF